MKKRMGVDHVALKRESDSTSLWYHPEEKFDMTIYTVTGCHKFPFEEEFKIMAYPAASKNNGNVLR